MVPNSRTLITNKNWLKRMLAVDMISKLFYLRTEPSLAIKDMNGHGGTFVQRDPNKPAIQVTHVHPTVESMLWPSNTPKTAN